MTGITITDTVALDSKVRITSDGYLVADARVARTGIQVYRGDELGLEDREILRVYRPENEVFSTDTLKSYAHRPVTLNHPKEDVNSKNWKDLAIGQTGDEILRDGNFVRVPMMLMDQKAIDSVQNGIRELSMGYKAELVLQDGVTPEGEAYDAIMMNLRMNHLAVVPVARGGSHLKIGDSEGDEPMADPVLKTQTVVVDGLSIQTTEQGAQIIEKLQKQLTDAKTAHDKLVSDHSVELAKKDAELDSIKAKVVSDADLDKRVASRSALIEVAKRIFPNLVADGKSDDEVRRMTVVAKVGDAMKDKDQAYINARFDVLAEDSQKTPPVGTQPAYPGYVPPNVNDADRAYAESLSSMNSAWMTEQPKQ